MISSIIPRSTWGIAAGLGSIILIGYCLYFDRKRHNDPNFKRKLRERRRAERLKKSTDGGTPSKLPDLRDQEAVQTFCVSEIVLGEELLKQGDVDGAIEHFGTAIAVCGHPQQLLQVFQHVLPPQVIHLLLERLPNIGYSVHARQLATFGAPATGVGDGDGDCTTTTTSSKTITLTSVDLHDPNELE